MSICVMQLLSWWEPKSQKKLNFTIKEFLINKIFVNCFGTHFQKEAIHLSNKVYKHIATQGLRARHDKCSL